MTPFSGAAMTPRTAAVVGLDASARPRTAAVIGIDASARRSDILHYVLAERQICRLQIAVGKIRSGTLQGRPPSLVLLRRLRMRWLDFARDRARLGMVCPSH